MPGWQYCAVSFRRHAGYQLGQLRRRLQLRFRPQGCLPPTPGNEWFFGLVNRWGLGEMHGQLLECCGDQWQRYPLSGAAGDGSALEGPDPELEGNQEQTYRLLRGGSWISDPHNARAAFRGSVLPAGVYSSFGVRPGCFSPPGLLLSS